MVSSATPRGQIAYLPNDFDVSCTGAIIGSNGIDNSDNISLHHPNIVGVAILLGEIEEVLDEVHDIGPNVHVALRFQVSLETQHYSPFVIVGMTYPLELLEDAGVQVLTHVFVLQGKLGGFLG
jgi:hypothetical protein